MAEKQTTMKSSIPPCLETLLDPTIDPKKFIGRVFNNEEDLKWTVLSEINEKGGWLIPEGNRHSQLIQKLHDDGCLEAQKTKEGTLYRVPEDIRIELEYYQ